MHASRRRNAVAADRRVAPPGRMQWTAGPKWTRHHESTSSFQALVSAGEDISSAESPWMQQEKSPLVALLGWQGESGAFQADFGDGGFDDFFSTVQSIPALGLITPPMAEPSPEPTERPAEVVEPTVMPEPAELPTETPLPPTAEPTLPPEPTATPVEAPAEVENTPASEPAAQSEADSEGGGIDPVLAVLIGLGVIVLAVGVAIYAWIKHE